MVTQLKDLSTWANMKNLQPENMTPLLVMLAQGPFIAEDIFPAVPSTDAFQWETEDSNDKFTVARKRGERGGATLNDFTTSKLTAEAYEYFEGAQITAKALRSGNIYSFVNLTVRKMEMIASKIRMNIEKDLLAAMQDRTTYATINYHSCSVNFLTRGTSDPIKDFSLAVNKIRGTEHVEADVIILGGTDKTNMTLSDNIRDTQQYTKDYTTEGLVYERVNGLQLYTSTAVYKSGTSYISILSGQAVIMKRGIAGELKEAEAYLADSDFNKGNKVLTLYGSRVIKPVVIRPKAICLVANVS